MSATIDFAKEIVTLIAIVGGSLVSTQNIKKVEKAQNNLNKSFNDFVIEYEENEAVIKDLVVGDKIAKRINDIVNDAVNGYLSSKKNKENAKIAGLIATNGDAAKNLMNWVIQTKLVNITIDDFFAKYEELSVPMRQQLASINSEYSCMIRGTLNTTGNRLILKIKEILESDTMNNKVMRINTATEFFLQEIVHYIVESWIKYNALNTLE